MEDLKFWLSMLSFLFVILVIIYLRNKKDNSVIITDENFNKIDLIKLFKREIKRKCFSSKIGELSYSLEIIKNLTKEEENKVKIFLKEKKIKYKETDEILEKIIKIKTEKAKELELKKAH